MASNVILGETTVSLLLLTVESTTSKESVLVFKLSILLYKSVLLVLLSLVIILVRFVMDALGVVISVKRASVKMSR